MYYLVLLALVHSPVGSIGSAVELVVLGDHEHTLAALCARHARPACAACDLLVHARIKPHDILLGVIVVSRDFTNDHAGRGQVDASREGRGAHDHVDEVVLGSG